MGNDIEGTYIVNADCSGSSTRPNRQHFLLIAFLLHYFWTLSQFNNALSEHEHSKLSMHGKASVGIQYFF